MSADHSSLFYKHLAQTTPFAIDIEIERAKGTWLYSCDGKKYIDLISGIGVSHIGHGHPRIIEAVKKQVDRHFHVMVYGEYVQAPQVKLATKLADILPPSLSKVYFTNSGTEANEGALKLAKRYTGRQQIISFHHAYHGSTHGSLSVSGNESRKQAFRPLLPGIRFIPFNESAGLEAITGETACVIMETIQGDAGVRIPAGTFMKALRKRCDETGALLILDEIQTGMGRTGKWFAFEHFDIAPDILTLGKALGGGLPLGAFISRPDIMEALTHDPPLGHITTFGGNPVCCGSALAAIEVIEEEHLMNEVERKGQLLEKKLQHPVVKEIRRKGL
ncbi:MAG: aspartate aminotransferase family protein, partial [Cyclobacteriaceae bacterium]|nr:aspartate aminotransferase family protein [Cyclobacteriaceae bacterium]